MESIESVAREGLAFAVHMELEVYTVSVDCVIQGQFIQTYQYGGDFFGLQMESIESVAREGLAFAVHMELEV